MIKTLKACLLAITILMAPIGAYSANTVDINKADAATLIENLNGIGKVRARAIVDYRKRNGPFGDIDDLANVPGIGQALIKKNRRLLSVRGGLTASSTGKSTSASKKTTSKSSASSSKTAGATAPSRKSTDKPTSKKKTSSSAATSTAKKESKKSKKPKKKSASTKKTKTSKKKSKKATAKN